jgi:hypothetical protein
MKFDDGKLPYHLIDDAAEAEMVAVLGFGAVKYEPQNWRIVEQATDRYFDAIRRHLRAARRGEVLDPEHGLLTLAAVACNAHFLLALELANRPDLKGSLPTRYRAALDKARALREARLAKVRPLVKTRGRRKK